MFLRSIKIAIVLLLICSSAISQVVTRSEFAPYTLRKDADARTHTPSDTYIEFNPTLSTSALGLSVREQTVEVSQSWVDAVAMFHVENPGSAYTLTVNGKSVAECEDSYTPTDYNITPYLFVGSNSVKIISRPSRLSQLEEGLKVSARKPFEGSYIYTQRRLRILDYQLELTEHTEGQHGQLFIDIIVENGFNYPETIEVGFDVYDPAGKLHDFSTAKATVEGNSVDTIRFAPHLYGAAKYRWDPSKKADQSLYSVMIFTKHNGVSSNYIPFKVGFTLPKYAYEKLTVWDKDIILKAVSYNALGDAKQAETELTALRQQGYNTIAPDYPQPLWFYSLCDKLGLWVIDQAAINAPTAAGDKKVGGSPSNDPALRDEYLERMQKTYYRTRNFSCVVAYSLGGSSGNGYNMYKAYQWLKSVEKVRPIIYQGAGGEWNNDILKIGR
ncbi:MAG: glycoside hydrolase family 2 TIM barrel-domain containing protein [Rikenellaceae bacterium]